MTRCSCLTAVKQVKIGFTEQRRRQHLSLTHTNKSQITPRSQSDNAAVLLKGTCFSVPEVESLKLPLSQTFHRWKYFFSPHCVPSFQPNVIHKPLEEFYTYAYTRLPLRITQLFLMSLYVIAVHTVQSKKMAWLCFTDSPNLFYHGFYCNYYHLFQMLPQSYRHLFNKQHGLEWIWKVRGTVIFSQLREHFIQFSPERLLPSCSGFGKRDVSLVDQTFTSPHIEQSLETLDRYSIWLHCGR